MKIEFYPHYLLDPVYLLFLELPGIIVVYFQGPAFPARLELGSA